LIPTTGRQGNCRRRGSQGPAAAVQVLKYDKTSAKASLGATPGRLATHRTLRWTGSTRGYQRGGVRARQVRKRRTLYAVGNGSSQQVVIGQSSTGKLVSPAFEHFLPPGRKSDDLLGDQIAFGRWRVLVSPGKLAKFFPSMSPSSEFFTSLATRHVGSSSSEVVCYAVAACRDTGNPQTSPQLFF